MTGRLVTGTLLFNDGAPCVGARVLATLAGADEFLSDGGVVAGKAAAMTDSRGQWAMYLAPNSSLEPAGGAWLIAATPPGYDIPISEVYVAVPDVPGPHQVDDVVVDAPGGSLRYDPPAGAVLPQQFGAKADGTTDDTGAINDAIESAISRGIGAVYLPPGHYLVNGTISIPAPITFAGWWTSQAVAGAPSAGTVLVAGSTSTPGAPVLEVALTGSKVAGVRLERFHVLGADSWLSSSGAKDRVGVRLKDVGSEVSMDAVYVSGFQRQGMVFDEVFDATIVGSRVFFCGADDGYPAVDVLGGGADNTNAMHVFGLHVENCPFMLRVDDLSRHVQFVACKFELFSQSPVYSPIQILDAVEIEFVGCQFVQRGADDSGYADSSAQPHMVSVSGESSVIGFQSCMFTAAPTATSPLSPSSRWVTQTGGRVKIVGSTFNRCWGGAGPVPIDLGSAAVVNGNYVAVQAVSGYKGAISLSGGCAVVGNVFDVHGVASNGTLVVDEGGGNVIASNATAASA